VTVLRLMFDCNRWLASRYGHSTTRKSAPCQEVLLFMNVTQVGKADLCTDADGMINVQLWQLLE